MPEEDEEEADRLLKSQMKASFEIGAACREGGNNTGVSIEKEFVRPITWVDVSVPKIMCASVCSQKMF